MADVNALVQAILDDKAMPEHMVTRQDEEGMRALLLRHLTPVDRPLPDYVQGLPANDRAMWRAVELTYDAAVSYHPGEERTMTPFRDLTVDAQMAVVHTALPLISTLHQLGLNPAARADAEGVTDRG